MIPPKSLRRVRGLNSLRVTQQSVPMKESYHYFGPEQSPPQIHNFTPQAVALPTERGTALPGESCPRFLPSPTMAGSSQEQVRTSEHAYKSTRDSMSIDIKIDVSYISLQEHDIKPAVVAPVSRNLPTRPADTNPLTYRQVPTIGDSNHQIGTLERSSNRLSKAPTSVNDSGRIAVTVGTGDRNKKSKPKSMPLSISEPLDPIRFEGQGLLPNEVEHLVRDSFITNEGSVSHPPRIIGCRFRAKTRTGLAKKSLPISIRSSISNTCPSSSMHTHQQAMHIPGFSDSRIKRQKPGSRKD